MRLKRYLLLCIAKALLGGGEATAPAINGHMGTH